MRNRVPGRVFKPAQPPLKKILLVTLATVFITCLNILPASAQQLELPRLTAEAAVLMDYQTGHVLYSYQAARKLAPASTTKVLTALLGLELGKETEIVTVSPYASGTEGTSMDLRPGLSFYLRDLIKGALVNSGNDAAVAIGEHLAGTEVIFASLMTYKAKTIGASQSTFVNPHGLDNPGHYCTAYDLALIARYALCNQLFRQFVQTRDDVIYERKTNTSIHLSNTNRLLWNNENDIKIFGVKTGTTSIAGQCLIAAADQDGRMLITVVLNSADRYADTLKLLKYGYQKCRWFTMTKDQELITIPVLRGRCSTVKVGSAEDICFAVNPQKLSLLDKRMEIQKVVKAPLASGDLVGKIDFYLGGRFLCGTALKILTPVVKKPLLF